MKNKNVLHLVEYLYLGGIERLLQQLAANNENKTNLHFFSYETTTLDGIGREIKDAGFPVFTYKKKEGRDWALVKKIIDVVKENKIEVIHTHDFGPMEYAVILKLRFPRIKLIHTQHTIFNLTRSPKYLFFFQAASFFYKKIIGVSSFVNDTIKGYCPLIRENHLVVISNGVDVENFKPENEIKKEELLRLVSVSRISPEKNLDYLINTCILLKKSSIPFVFHHAGVGKTSSQLNELRNKIREHNLESEIILHGFTNDVKKILEMGDIFVSASHTEGHPVAVLEAMATEKLCMCSNIPSHKELGDSLILFDQKNEKDLFVILKEVMDKKNVLKNNERKKMGREKVLAHYSIDKMVKNYAELYA